ncbi:MAG: sensor histidine kinase [Anaerolineae bacterium]
MDMNMLPGERARREVARWLLWSYVGFSALSIGLHLQQAFRHSRVPVMLYVVATAVIGIAAFIGLIQLKRSLSGAMQLFAWITYVSLITLLNNNVKAGAFTNVTSMFIVGIFALGMILGFKPAIWYATATATIFIVLGVLYGIPTKMVVPVVLAYAVALPAKLVERLIDQSTRDLEQLNQRLEALVAERTAELAESNQQLRAEMSDRMHVEVELRQRTVELESRNEELNAYAHTVAHDIKSPLASIIGFGELLERHASQFSEEKLTYYFGVIARNGRKITNIVDELLLLSSVREAKVVDVGPLDMAAIVDEVQHRLIHDIAEKRPEIILPATWPVALGYAPWVEEIWTNYISNAIKYGGDPPNIELGYTFLDSQVPVEDLESPLSLDTLRSQIGNSQSKVIFWLRDNGPGLTPKERARLFTPFTRLDQVRAKGHGLGLSIVRRIAERLDGEVGVESVVGQGSTFFFTLPAAPADTSGDDSDTPGEIS